MRRDQLCDPGLCPDAPDGGRCDHCPLDSLDAAQHTAMGHLIRRATELRRALNLGFQITLDDIRADEFLALLILEDEAERYSSENSRETSPR